MTTHHPLTRLIGSSTIALVALLALVACDHQDVVAPQETMSEQHAHAGPATISNANVVEVIARHEGEDYVFDLSDEVIPSGWTTFELDNHSSATHFAWIAKVPRGAHRGAAKAGMELLDYWIESVTNPFQAVMDGIIAGDPDAFDPFNEMPGWFSDPGPRPSGGPGFLAGHENTRTTVYLDEGTYIIECYVKDGDGQFHSATGMIALLEVDNDLGHRGSEPRASFDVVVSSDGIEAADRMRPGLHNVRVHFADQQVYGNGLGHDVHLIRLNGEDVEDVAQWLNWMLPTGLESSSRDRGPQTFLGGVQTMAAGDIGYMTVNLTPGEYAWIAEVPADVGMWKTFTVPHGTTTGRR